MLRLWALIASLLQRCNDIRIGFALPNIGPIGSPEAVATVATRDEALGYDSLWTIERRFCRKVAFSRVWESVSH